MHLETSSNHATIASLSCGPSEDILSSSNVRLARLSCSWAYPCLKRKHCGRFIKDVLLKLLLHIDYLPQQAMVFPRSLRTLKIQEIAEMFDTQGDSQGVLNSSRFRV